MYVDKIRKLLNTSREDYCRDAVAYINNFIEKLSSKGYGGIVFKDNFDDTILVDDILMFYVNEGFTVSNSGGLITIEWNDSINKVITL